MRWRDTLSLSTQFLIASVVVLCLAMGVLGTWVSHEIKRNVMATSGADGAAFIRAMLEEHVQRIDSQGQLHPEDIAALDRLFLNTVLGTRVLSVKLWRKTDGTRSQIIYSSIAKETVGEVHDSTEVEEAWSGTTVTEFDDLNTGESRFENAIGFPLIEIYAPLVRSGTTEVVAVGEIYHEGSLLAQRLREGVAQTWIVVCLTTLLMIIVLYLIVRKASVLLHEQRCALRVKVQEAEEMAAQNHALRLAADRSRLDASEANEELLGRIGLDIHDGPIQFLTLIRFRMDEIAQNLSIGARSPELAAEELQELGGKLSANIDELRDLSVGLVLPELDALSLLQTIKLAVERHEHLTGSHVRVKYGRLHEKVPGALKTCVYRVVQESLTNSFKHAGGQGQRVSAIATDGVLMLEIRDDGRPMTSSQTFPEGFRLGQRGIRNRVAAFNGSVTIEPHASRGTRVSIEIPLDDQRSG